jgi:hypothetical protein
MTVRGITKVVDTLQDRSIRALLSGLWAAPWQVILGVSFLAGMGSGWTVLLRPSSMLSPFLAAITMMLATYAGWYAWAFFTHLADMVFFGKHGSYQDTLDCFGQVYVLQVLSSLTFAGPLGWMWTWVASYLTVAAWGVAGPRRLGMKSWQAIVAATVGLLLWLACLAAVTLLVTKDGMYVGIGAFLA